MTLRVCQLITELDPGGAERVVYDLATGLAPGLFESHVVSLTPATGDVARWLRAQGIPVSSAEIRHKADVGAVKRLAAILRDVGPHVLHTHLAHANVLGRIAGKRAGVPVILSTAHDIERRFRPWRRWIRWRSWECLPSWVPSRWSLPTSRLVGRAGWIP